MTKGNINNNKLMMVALTLCAAASAVAGGAGTRLILTSEALMKELILWDATCPPERHERGQQECANDKRTLVTRLLEFAKYCDGGAASFEKAVGDAEEVKTANAVWKLQARVARFYAKYLGSPTLDAAGKMEMKAIRREHDRILNTDAKSDEKEGPRMFATVGLLSDESMAWLISGWE